MNKSYINFIQEIKQNIINSRYTAARLANKEQLLLYYKVGMLLSEKMKAEKWGAKILKQLSEDIRSQLPGIKGFSERNLLMMKQFYVDYQGVIITQSLTAQLGKRIETPITQSLTAQKEAFFGISFTHHILLLDKCKDIEERIFYMQQAAAEFWSVRKLEHQINASLFQTQGKLPSNFNSALPAEIKANAFQVFQDEYLFDFINLDEDAGERIFEAEIVSNIKNSIMALGKGFAFLGNQYRLEVGGQEFFIDLLFYNRHLQCLVVFELKKGDFKPEHAGQLNFYLNVLDDKVKLPHENPSIGIILCKEKNNTVVEFAFKNVDKGMGAATYKTTKKVPKEMKGILPDINRLSSLM